MLCVITDNLADKHIFPNLEVIIECFLYDLLECCSFQPVETDEKIKKYKKVAKYKGWFQQFASEESFSKTNQFGSPVVIVDQEGFSHRFGKDLKGFNQFFLLFLYISELPSKGSNFFCNRKKEIKYLQNYESECTLDISNLKENCEKRPEFKVEPYLTLLFRSSLKEKKVCIWI